MLNPNVATGHNHVDILSKSRLQLPHRLDKHKISHFRRGLLGLVRPRPHRSALGQCLRYMVFSRMMYSHTATTRLFKVTAWRFKVTAWRFGLYFVLLDIFAFLVPAL